jgi:hypothetical protein
MCFYIKDLEQIKVPCQDSSQALPEPRSHFKNKSKQYPTIPQTLLENRPQIILKYIMFWDSKIIIKHLQYIDKVA